jgi:hypothetical protein
LAKTTNHDGMITERKFPVKKNHQRPQGASREGARGLKEGIMAQGVAGKIKRTGERSHEEIHLITCITLLPGSRRSRLPPSKLSSKKSENRQR